MRIVAGLALAVGVVLQILIGGSLVFSSTYEGTGGLSDVSSDLVNEEQLRQMAKTEDPQRQQRLVLGIAAAALGAAQIVSTVLVFLRRGKAVVAVLSALSLASAALVMVVHKPLPVAGIAIGLIAAGLVLALLASRSPGSA